MIVVASPEQAEALLDAGKLGCPGCAGALHAHGYGRIRRVRSLGVPVIQREGVLEWRRRNRLRACGLAMSRPSCKSSEVPLWEYVPHRTMSAFQQSMQSGRDAVFTTSVGTTAREAP